MSETVSLQEVREQPVPAVVEKLEELLELAKAGEVIAIAVAATTTGRHTGSVFEIGEGTIADLYMATARLQQRLLEYEV